MFSQYFGNYLLNNGLISSSQLREVMKIQSEIRLKLGVLAVNSGYMSPMQVMEVHDLQKKMDKKFGEIAVEKGYLTGSQVEELLSTQKRGHLLLGQGLVDKGYMSLDQLQAALEGYKKANGLTDERFRAFQQGDIDEIVNTFVNFSGLSGGDAYKDYVTLMMKNIIRFIDNSPRLEKNYEQASYSTPCLVCQEIMGEVGMFTGIAAGEKVFLEMAGRYAGEELKEIDELAGASVAEFLNLNNGIFLVNMSNRGVELEMKPQIVLTGKTTVITQKVNIIPVYLPAGRADIIISGSVPSLE
ncbi:MAG: hypothetical protein ACOY31_08055 [Bacillota bacterium]